MNRNHDPELEEFRSDPRDREVITLLQASRPGTPPLDPSFRSMLRARLMSAARQALVRPARRSWFDLGWRPVPALATVAASFLIVAAGVVLYQNLRQEPSKVAIVNTIEGKKDVLPAEPIKLEFRGPVDKNAVAQSVEIQPAAQYTSRWEGQTLVIIPLRPLAANTGYTVTVRSTPDAAPTAVRFVTNPSPPPPVVPPQFRAENLTFLGESRVAEPRTFDSFAWAPDGQALLVTRPVSEKPSASPSAPPAAEAPRQQSLRAASQTEIWLVSLQGTPVRRVAPRASDPSVSPGGERVAFWRITSTGEVLLMVSALQDDGTNATKLATLSTLPVQAPVWIGSDRLAYADGGQLRFVDLQGLTEIVRSVKPNAAIAASADGRLLAIPTPDGPVLYDRISGATRPLPDGASRFAWSPAGDLGFAVPGSLGIDVWALQHDAKQPRVIATAPGDPASEFNWAPDGNALLFATRAAPSDGQGPAAAHALIVNADGKSGIKPLGNIRSEYGAIRWSPIGRDIAFTRRDESNRPALWTAGISLGQPSAADRAQLEAQAEVDRFMTLRMDGKRSEAEAELGPDALDRFRSSANPAFARFYKVGVQLVTADKLLIGVRIVLADPQTKQETSYFEEHLTVVRHDDRFRIDAVEIGPTVRLGRGPSVLSVVEVLSSGDDTPKRQLQVRFDADLDPDTVLKENIYLRTASGDRVSADFSFDPTTRQVTLMPRKLPVGKYQLVVSTDVTDIKGQPLSQVYTSPLVVE